MKENKNTNVNSKEESKMANVKTPYQKFAEKVKGKYPAQAIEHACEMHFAHPKLTERLCTLKEEWKKEWEKCLRSKKENPWYEDMIAAGVKKEDIQILSEYFAFKDAEKQEYLMKSSGSRIYAMSPDFPVCVAMRKCY